MLGKAKAEAAAAALAAAAKAKVGVSTVVRASEDVIRRRRVAALTDAERAQVREVFDRADTLRRGRVDGVEVRGALHALSGKWMSDEELGVFWAELSPDGAETIGFAEFLHALGPTMFPPQSVRVVQAVALRAKEAAKPLAEQAGGRAAALAHLTTEGLVAKVLDAARKAVTADALDPDMPRPLRSAVTFVLGAVFADVEVEVREHVLGLLHGRAPPAPPPPPRRNPLARALHGLRAAILYTAKPYDLSVWRQLRSPGFWLLKAVSVFPLYGVQPAYFILTFLLIDKGDECQLVDFILTFKSSQFFSIGLIAMALGALWYYSLGCGLIFFDESWAAYAFLAQVVTVWVAFALLPFSREKGRARVKLPSEPDETGERAECCGRAYFQNRGGRLRPLLAYECCAFAVYVGLVGVALGTRQPWPRVEETIYWARTLYGLLSAPFFFFVLPVVGAMLTHARPTAYDRHGRCVPVLTPKEMRASREARLAAAEAAREKARDARELRRRSRKGAKVAVVVEARPVQTNGAHVGDELVAAGTSKA